MMKVVHVGAFGGRNDRLTHTHGGLDRFLEEIAIAQRKIGIQVETVDVLQADLSVVAEVVANQDWGRLSTIGCELLGHAQGDVFHLHDWYGAVVLDHLYTSGIRSIVATSHLPLRRGFTYRDSGLSWTSKSVLESRCFKALKYVTAPSQYVRTFLLEEYGLSAARVPVVPHGVNTADFKYCELQKTPSSDVQLLAVGRITDQKGFELLVRAMPLILTKEPTATLTIVGDGGAKLTLVNLVSNLNLEGNVEVKPSMEKDELATAYSNATILVVPSQFEPFGLVGLEAMACGCPVFAISPTGASEYLEEFELTPHYQIADLGNAILKRLHGLRSSVNPRHKARERAEEFSWEKPAASYATLYKNVMQ